MIGIFIGSFNPPTLTHLDISLKLLENLKKIVFVPVNTSEKKLISLKDRIAMLNIYTNKYANLIVDDIMIDYSYLNYRIIDLLKSKYKNITLIMGSDLLDKLDTFDNYLYLLKNYSFIIIERKNFPSSIIIENKYMFFKDKFTIINYQSNISSTMARKLLKSNQNTENVLDTDVLEYIKKHELY